MSREAGNESFRSGDLQRAAELYTVALETAPDDPKLWGNRCEVWLRTCQFDRALDDASRSAELEPSSAKAHYRVARALLGMEAIGVSVEGAHEKALASLFRAAAAAPDSQDVLELLADLVDEETLPEHLVSTLSANFHQALLSGAAESTVRHYLQLGVSPLSKVYRDAAEADDPLWTSVGTVQERLGWVDAAEWLWTTNLFLAVAHCTPPVLQVMTEALKPGEIDLPCCAAQMKPESFIRLAPPLAVAIISRRVETVKLLLQSGASAAAQLPAWSECGIPGCMLALALDGSATEAQRADETSAKRDAMRHAARQKAQGLRVEARIPTTNSMAARKPVVALLIGAGADVAGWRVRLSDGSEVFASDLLSSPQLLNPTNSTQRVVECSKDRSGSDIKIEML